MNFIKRLFRPSLYSAVMAVVKQVISEVEAAYNQNLDQIEEALVREKARVKQEYKNAKAEALSSAVNSITSKLR